MKKKNKLIFIVVVIVVSVIAMFDALNILDDSPYKAVPHGGHNHYVPQDRDMDMPLDAFPTEEPRKDERILPDGRVVKK